MSVSNELMYALLAMDAYNRGYGAGINVTGTHIGNAVIGDDSLILNSDPNDPNRVDQAAGFYAAAYTYNGETIISYRGTNTAPDGAMSLDIANGWATGAGDFRASQFDLATKFLESERSLVL